MQSRILLWVIVAGFGLLGCSTQPRHEGRTLKQWLMVYHEADDDSPEEQQAIAAVRRMGTNAIPYLTKWITDEDWRIYQTAVHMFKVLGPEAAMAVPNLERMLMGTNELVATLAGSALGNIGQPALPVLMAALTNRQFRVVTDAALALVELGTNARPAVPILLAQLEHPHWAYRQWAANVLGLLAIEPDTVVPALARLLRDNYRPIRFTALSGLKQFGSQARPAVPVISRLLVDLDENLRKDATNTLRQIAPESPPTFTY
jgi:HEAT repeat protein